MIKHRKPLTFLALLAFVASVELAARSFLQLPIYLADAEQGYSLSPNQSGAFAGNHWSFNELGMGVDTQFDPGPEVDLLLVGDSLVFGGTELDQRDRLGATISRQSGVKVWPLAAGSWNLVNELRAVKRTAALRAEIDKVVFVVNSGDFDGPSHWENNNTHPTKFPAIYSWYILNRYILNFDDGVPGIPVRIGSGFREWNEFLSNENIKNVEITVIGYSQDADGNCPWIPAYIVNSVKVRCFDANYLKNNGGLRDSIHPNAKGNIILANELIKEISVIAR